MEASLNQRFGSLVAAYRKRARMTQAQLASSTEMSVDMISRIESGSSGARFQTVEKIAEALQVDVGALFNIDAGAPIVSNPKLEAIVLRLAKMSDSDLDWVSGVLESVLSRRTGWSNEERERSAD